MVECPRLLEVRIRLICDDIRNILKINLIINHEFVLLGRFPEGTMNCDDKYLIGITPITALKLIMRKSCKKVLPQLATWREEMEQVKCGEFMRL